MPLITKQDDRWEEVTGALPDWQPLDTATDSILLPVDFEPNEDICKATSIAIDFPAFNDGRGLSLGVLLRTRFKYQGQLCAAGAIHEDIIHYLIRCGFDAILLPEDRDLATALALTAPYSSFYQGSAISAEPSFRRVARG